MDTKKYDVEATEAYKASSAFHVQGFTESFFQEGRLVGEERHDGIPHGRTPGSPGEIKFTITEPRKFSRLGRRQTVKFPQVKLTSRIDAICGRMKKSIHDLL